MEIVALEKYIRTSQKKLKGLASIIVNMNGAKALEKLNNSYGKSARILAKTLKSALSNAKNNSKLNEQSLVVKKVEILKGPFFKRWQPVSRGMAHSIKKRTTHIKIILTDGKAKAELPSPKTKIADKPLEKVAEAKPALIKKKKNVINKK